MIDADKSRPQYEVYGLMDMFNRPPTVCRARFQCRGEAEAKMQLENSKFSHSQWPRYQLVGYLPAEGWVRV